MLIGSVKFQVISLIKVSPLEGQQISYTPVEVNIHYI